MLNWLQILTDINKIILPVFKERYSILKFCKKIKLKIRFRVSKKKIFMKFLEIGNLPISPKLNLHILSHFQNQLEITKIARSVKKLFFLKQRFDKLYRKFWNCDWQLLSKNCHRWLKELKKTVFALASEFSENSM